MIIKGLQELYQPGFLQALLELVLQLSAIRRWLLEKDLLCPAFALLISQVKLIQEKYRLPPESNQSQEVLEGEEWS